MPRLDAISRANDGEESRAWLRIRVDANVEDVDLPLLVAAFSGGGEVVDASLLG